MPTWNYWHRLEYRRVLRKGHYLHEYTEVVEDQGWVLQRRGMSKEEYFTYYTQACARDFLGRVRATPGTWIVAVYHTGETSDGPRTLRGSIRMRWQPLNPG
ncbi:hypothetical protein EV191_103156 [Tamaricihabitans halophyticus]|uniref:Uncharacterized protein n=1 Tax=Tamaricihabitans halophyticus TaxID=1262583 RepID=A0A4R2R405_9PSEU|nr:hypothetical protein [Tamaricihabitans halophyticus]TCP54115.1 hypothetical protein EV191_103156 [Tamaricihabitans halophyticus]